MYADEALVGSDIRGKARFQNRPTTHPSLITPMDILHSSMPQSAFSNTSYMVQDNTGRDMMSRRVVTTSRVINGTRETMTITTIQDKNVCSESNSNAVILFFNPSVSIGYKNS